MYKVNFLPMKNDPSTCFLKILDHLLVNLYILLHTKMWWHWIYRFMTLFLETENSINSHNLIPLIRQVLGFAPVKVSLKLHFSCVHLMKGNQKIANFYEKKSKSFQQSFQSKSFVLFAVLFRFVTFLWHFFFLFSLLSLVWQTLVN